LRPETRYAAVGDAHIAYQVIGEGPIDIVYHGGWYSHVDGSWDIPPLARFLERLASFGRVIMFDRRGHGMSDPIDLDNVTLEQWMEDLDAVMTAVGSDRHVLIGVTETGPMQILYAATYPERTRGLVLINTTASFARRDDYPWGMPEKLRRLSADMLYRFILGEDDTAMAYISPADMASPAWRESTLRMIRYATSPAMVLRLMDVSLELDVRAVLPSVHVPTLILQREEQPFVRVGHGRYLADNIAGAKYVELPGGQLQPWGADDTIILDEIEEFVTGVPPTHEPDRVLATVLFTDIVSSTEHAAAVGDKKWLGVLEAHNRTVRREIERYRGREVATAGDGFLATFDGPARAVRCARAVVDQLKDMDLDVRAGVHTGEIELVGADVQGIAVHIGARVAALASAGEVLVSRTVTDLVAGSGLSFTERGSHALKGVPGEWQLYAVER
jgi:class 3 adenylate cyclase